MPVQLRLFAISREVLRACACAALSTAMLVSVVDANAGSVAYTYDALGRVATVVYTNAGTTTTITYSYDAAGNRTSVVTTSP